MIERAIQIAVEAHAGQKDLAGKPYILHPLAVMGKFTDPDTQIVAVLHDLFEDTTWTPKDLEKEGFQPKIVHYISILTRDKNMSYQEYIRRIMYYDLTVAVKVADLEHNLDPHRSLGWDPRSDIYRKAKYTLAHNFLTYKISEYDYNKRMQDLEYWKEKYKG